MPTDPGAWEPVNDVERTLRYAWEQEDGLLLLRTLAGAPLYLPGFSGGGRGGSAQPQRLLTRVRGDRTYLIVFTSPEALHDGLDEVVDGWRLTSVPELVRTLPDPGWGLAVSPNLPIGAYLGPEQLEALAELVADEPVFHAADANEAVMFRAQRTAAPGTYLDVLVMSEVLLPLAAPAAAGDLGRADFPWRVEVVDHLRTVSVFTSPQRLTEALPDPVPAVRVDLVVLLNAWPDPDWRLSVNPGSAIATVFTGGQVPELLQWARALIVRMEDPSTVERQPVALHAPAAPDTALDAWPAFEVVVEPSEVDRYLVDGYDRLGGVAHRAGTAPVPAGGYLVRWRHEAGTPPEAGEMVRDLAVPSGARLYHRVGGERLVATYQAELHRWVRAVADLLRG
jgi:hypothetical protein